MTMSGMLTQDQSETKYYLGLGRCLQARGRAAGRAQLLRQWAPRMAQAGAGGATAWRRGLRPLRLAGILGSRCLHALHLSMEARQVLITEMNPSAEEAMSEHIGRKNG